MLTSFKQAPDHLQTNVNTFKTKFHTLITIYRIVLTILSIVLQYVIETGCLRQQIIHSRDWEGRWRVCTTGLRTRILWPCYLPSLFNLKPETSPRPHHNSHSLHNYPLDPPTQNPTYPASQEPPPAYLAAWCGYINSSPYADVRPLHQVPLPATWSLWVQCWTAARLLSMTIPACTVMYYIFCKDLLRNW